MLPSKRDAAGMLTNDEQYDEESSAMPKFPQPSSALPRKPYCAAQYDLLRDFAARYIWWKTVDEAMQYPERVLAQVMNFGTFSDLGRLLTAFTSEDLRSVLAQAEPGWFNERSWTYWHLRLGITPVNGTPPPLPQRTFPD
jgi:hypothetical protein